MTCELIEARLLDDDRAFLDRDVREHLKDCPACHRFYEELEEIEQLHRSLARRERAPLNFTGQVIHRVSRHSRFNFPLIAATGFTLAVLTVMAGVGTSPPVEPAELIVHQTSPGISHSSSLLLEQAQPVEFDASYPRVRIYVMDPDAPLKPEEGSRIEIRPTDQAQIDYLRYVSH